MIKDKKNGLRMEALRGPQEVTVKYSENGALSKVLWEAIDGFLSKAENY